jgi:hypothetical protein
VPEEIPDIVSVAKGFTRMGLPVFPVRVQKIGGKFQKVPLTKRGHLDASVDLKVNDWSRANALGIAMGNGWYAIDVDSAKGAPGEVEERVRQWAKGVGLETVTRSHRTPSGGWHLIYRLPAGWHELRTRANVVEGMDTRGAGGWIAFGEGYSVVRDVAPAMMSKKACEALDSGVGATGTGPVVLAGYTPPAAPEAVDAKLGLALRLGPNLLRFRWNGDRTGLADTSGSAMDHSVAKLLAIAGLSEDEIIWALLNRFEHGSARNKGQEHVAMRAAGRSAVKGRLSTDEEANALLSFKEEEETEEMRDVMQAAMLEALKVGK